MNREELRQHTRSHLLAVGIENADAEADWIILHILGIQRHELLETTYAVSSEQLEGVNDAIRRRISHEPLQYILGDVDFCGCTIEVTRDVLIPRPETEWIVETLLESETRTSVSALDVGTGSGCIAIAIAVRLAGSQVSAVDLSSGALNITLRNAEQNGVRDRLTLARSDMHSLPFQAGAFDLIVSNPPYIQTEDVSALDTDVRDFEPGMALDGGPKGTDFYAALAVQAGRLLKPGGRIWIELPGTDPKPVVDIFRDAEWVAIETLFDWAKKPRLLRAQNPT